MQTRAARRSDDRGQVPDETLRPDNGRQLTHLRRDARHGDRVPRPERIRQVHHNADDHGAGCAGRGPGHDLRPRLPRAALAAARGGLDAGGQELPSRPQRAQSPARPGGEQCHPARPGGRGARDRRPGNGRRPAGREVLARHGPAARRGGPAAPRSRRAAALRADPRPAAVHGRPRPHHSRVEPPDQRDGADGRGSGGDRAGAVAGADDRGGPVRRGGVAGGSIPAAHQRNYRLRCEAVMNITSTRPASRPVSHYGFGNAARMEWIKLRSLRSTRWTLLIMTAGMIGLGILVLRYYPAHWRHMSAADKASFDPVNAGFTGVALAQLAMGMLGVLAVTGEYSSGMIRSTLAAVPNRPLLLAAKAAVFGAAALAIGELLSFATFLISQATLASPAPHATLGQPGVLRAVLMIGAYLCLVGLIGLGLGAIVRHSAGAIAALVGVILVLPPILAAFPDSVQHAAGRFLPEVIAENSLAISRPVPYSLSPWAGLGLLCLYAAVVLGAGCLLLARRDA